MLPRGCFPTVHGQRHEGVGIAETHHVQHLPPRIFVQSVEEDAHHVLPRGYTHTLTMKKSFVNGLSKKVALTADIKIILA